MGDSDLAGLKAMLPAMLSVIEEARVNDLELVAEGDAVTARFNHSITLHDGSTTAHRGLAYYRLADGKIVVNDVMLVPDMMQVLGPLMAPPPGAHVPKRFTSALQTRTQTSVMRVEIRVPSPNPP